MQDKPEFILKAYRGWAFDEPKNIVVLPYISMHDSTRKAVEQLAAMIPNLKVEIIEPVLCKGLPKENDLAALDKLANSIAEKHKEKGFVQ